MNKKTIAALLMLIVPWAAKAQFNIGYGIGVFPTGMRTLTTYQAHFNKSENLNTLIGPVQEDHQLMPFHHGIVIGYSGRFKGSRKTAIMLSWSNLHNKAESQRLQNSSNQTYYFRQKSRFNSLLFGFKRKFGEKFKIAEAWTLSGMMGTHTHFYSSGTGSAAEEWQSKDKEFVMGFDIGLVFKLAPKVKFFIHYNKALIFDGVVNPTYVGGQLYFELGKKKY